MSRRASIVVTGADLAPSALGLLSDYEVIFAGKFPQEEDLIALCRRYDPVAIIVRYGGVGASVMDAAPSLRVISKHGSGTDTVDRAAANERGIQVRATAGANAAAVAEHATALILSCAKSIKHLDHRMCEGHWDKATHKSLELSGRTLGVIGLGAIGLRVARIFDAMGMEIIGFDPRAPETPLYVRTVDLETIWRQSDAITLHCPLTDETKYLVNRETISKCKPGVVIVNTARGSMVDEVALGEALCTGQVSSAGLDCFQEEPPAKRHQLSCAPNVVLTPHVAGLTNETYLKMGVDAVNNVLAVLQGCRRS